MNLEQKLFLLMDTYKISNTSLAESLFVDRSTVSKWRSGARTFDARHYANRAAKFLTEVLEDGAVRYLLGLDKGETNSKDLLCAKMLDFLSDGRDIIPETAFKPAATIGRKMQNPGCFLGLQGLFDALSLFSDVLKNAVSQAPVTVYLSSEFCGLLLDDGAAQLWNYLYELNGGCAVRVIFEQWQESVRVARVIERLLPYIQEGKLEICYIPSSERLLCYNISFVAQDLCMVVTTEPVGGGTYASLFVDSPAFVLPMSSVLQKLSRKARPIARQIRLPRVETSLINSFFVDKGEIRAASESFNLIYAPMEEYRQFLSGLGLPYEKVRYYTQRFISQKVEFERFLEDGEYWQLVSLDTITALISAQQIKIPDLSFPEGHSVSAPTSLVRAALEGMIGYMKKFRRLHISLMYKDVAETKSMDIRVKEDRFMLLHIFDACDCSCIYSDNWFFVDLYNSRIDEVYHSKTTINNSGKVIAALKKHIAETGGKSDEYV